MFQKEQELVNAVEEIKKNILIINGLIMKIRIKNPIWGVPITFLFKYNPKQFTIIDMSTMSGVSANYWTMINGVPKYSRVFIKKI